MKSKERVLILFLILFLNLILAFNFVSAGILCDYFGVYCDKNVGGDLGGELGSSNPLAVQGSCSDGIDNDNDGKIDSND